MNVQEAMRLVERLPPERQIEIIDFIEFIYSRATPRAREEAHPPLEREPLCGLWKNREDMENGVDYVRELRRREWP
jgi:hypothetical protein